MRLIYLLFILLVTGLYAESNGSQSEIRAFWVVRYALRDSAEIDKIVRIAYESNVTDIFVQIRAKGETYYHSKLEKTAKTVNSDFDPLAYIIKRSSMYGIRVHAWVNMFFVWYGTAIPVDSTHCFTRFKSHLLKIENLPDYAELKAAGIEGYYLDPTNEQVQKYLLNLLLEIADKYDIAGIHLDYFRFPGVTYSFTGKSRSDFMIGNYFDPLQVYHDTEQYVQDRGYEVFVQADRQYRQFLIESLTLFLSEINNELKKKDPDLLLSIAVKPDPVKARYRYFQDWRSWLQAKYCDLVLIMNYRTDEKEFTGNLNQVEDLKEKIVVGISTYNQGIPAVNQRIDQVRESVFAGFALFSYNHLIENPAYLKSLHFYESNRGSK